MAKDRQSGSSCADEIDSFLSSWNPSGRDWKNILEALKPFINIVCSALILDGLVAGESAASVMKIVCWMVSLNLITALLIALLDWLRKSYLDVWCISQKKFSERALQLDYERLEETETRDMIRMHDETRNMYGGIPWLLRGCRKNGQELFLNCLFIWLDAAIFLYQNGAGKGMSPTCLPLRFLRFWYWLS